MTKKGMNRHPILPNDEIGQLPASFGSMDNDLAAENLANDFDLTAADMQDFRKPF